MAWKVSRWRWVTSALVAALAATVTSYFVTVHTTSSRPYAVKVSLWIGGVVGGRSAQIPGTVSFTSTRDPHEQIVVTVPRSQYVTAVLAPGTWSVVGRSPWYSSLCWDVGSRTVRVPHTGTLDVPVTCPTI